jgi:hypothetical protein
MLIEKFHVNLRGGNTRQVGTSQGVGDLLEGKNQSIT